MTTTTTTATTTTTTTTNTMTTDYNDYRDSDLDLDRFCELVTHLTIIDKLRNFNHDINE